MSIDEELRARLRQQADELVEQMMGERKTSGENSLEDIEELVSEASRRFRARVLHELSVAESEAGLEAVVCDRCGHRMGSRGRRKREIVSRVGEVTVERRSYVCPECGKRSFPPG